MTVTRLNVTPIKGTRLQDRQSVDLDANGVADNRRFYFIDERGLLVNGKKLGRLATIAAQFDPSSGSLTVRFPDGHEVSAVWVAGDAVTTSFYGRPVTGRLAGGPWSAAISAFSEQPLRLVAVDRLGDAVDVHPVTIVSQASIEALRASSGGAERLDYQRFRMLVEVDGIGANEEETWTGRQIQIGSAVVQIIGPVPRCIVTSQDPLTGERDFDTLGAIISHRAAYTQRLQTPTAHLPDSGKVVFGVYGSVIQTGRISVGDPVTADDSQAGPVTPLQRP